MSILCHTFQFKFSVNPLQCVCWLKHTGTCIKRESLLDLSRRINSVDFWSISSYFDPIVFCSWTNEIFISNIISSWPSYVVIIPLKTKIRVLAKIKSYRLFVWKIEVSKCLIVYRNWTLDLEWIILTYEPEKFKLMFAVRFNLNNILFAFVLKECQTYLRRLKYVLNRFDCMLKGYIANYCVNDTVRRTLFGPRSKSHRRANNFITYTSSDQTTNGFTNRMK